MLNPALQYFGLGFLLSLAGMPGLISWLKAHTAGKQIRPEGPSDHLSKAGTPNMGGLIFVPVIILGIILAWRQGQVVAWLAGTLIYGLMGFWDDIRQIFKSHSTGLRAREKLALQILAALALGLYLYRFYPGLTVIYLPWDQTLDTGIWFVPLAALALVASVNAVNLSDGLDGLAAGLSLIAAGALLYFMQDQAAMLQTGALVMGSLAAFMCFNVYPARIFMGDTGSLPLGAFLALAAILTHALFFWIIIGGMFALEALSVILQVGYFKLSGGKRIFKMSPWHHHFCLGGMHENQVTFRFWIAGLLLALTGVYLR